MGEACLVDRGVQAQWIPPAVKAETAWFALQTGYRFEQRVAGDLSAKGFETYLPLVREVHQWRDRKKIVDVPAFSGYLFIRCEPTTRNRVRVLETRGIVRLLGGNHAPLPISEQELDAVKMALGSGVRCERCETLTPGDMVRVLRGPLTGMKGWLMRVKNGARLVLAVAGVAQGISAEVGIEDVQPLTEVN